MAGGLVRIGDILGPGGLVFGPSSSSVTVNGRPVAFLGSVYTPHLGCSPKKPLHCFGTIIDFPGGLTIEGQIPLTKGGKGICGHGIMLASDDVISLGGGGLLSLVVGIALGQFGKGFSVDPSGNFGSFAAGFESTLAPVADIANTVEKSLTLIGAAKLGIALLRS
jgi:uncharacterized Zn-binding protein involved in type VI secretion